DRTRRDERDDAPRDGPGGGHARVEAEGRPARLRRRRFGEEGVPRGVADPLPGALDDSHREELWPGLSEREQYFHRGRQSVTQGDESLAFPRGVRKLAGEDLHE